MQIKENIKAPRHWPLRAIHQPLVNWPVARKIFPFDDVIMMICNTCTTTRRQYHLYQFVGWHWSRQWLGVIKQQASIWARGDPGCWNAASMGHIGLIVCHPSDLASLGIYEIIDVNLWVTYSQTCTYIHVHKIVSNMIWNTCTTGRSITFLFEKTKQKKLKLRHGCLFTLFLCGCNYISLIPFQV